MKNNLAKDILVKNILSAGKEKEKSRFENVIFPGIKNETKPAEEKLKK